MIESRVLNISDYEYNYVLSISVSMNMIIMYMINRIYEHVNMKFICT